MDNRIFYRRFRIGVILFFVLIIILSIVWFTSQENNKKEDVTFEELLNTEKETTNGDAINWENTDPSYWDSINWVLNRDPSYYRADNVKLIQEFKSVIKELYLMYGIRSDPEDYINFKVSIPNPEKYGINDWYFLAVDNYRHFLSDTAECNTGKESLRSFCGRIGYDDDFMRSRTKLKGVELEQFESEFGMHNPRFSFEHQSDKYPYWIVSWEELTKDKACLLRWYTKDSYVRYTYTRIDDLWYLTNFYHSFYNEIGLEE